jgi:hypothetical protein
MRTSLPMRRAELVGLDEKKIATLKHKRNAVIITTPMHGLVTLKLRFR